MYPTPILWDKCGIRYEDKKRYWVQEITPDGFSINLMGDIKINLKRGNFLIDESLNPSLTLTLE